MEQSQMKFCHYQCPAHPIDDERAPILVEHDDGRKRSDYARAFTCPDCHMIVAVTVLREPALIARGT